ncbi:hypothetical protein KFK09_022823 [Dendrobium nobile]|uniref:NOA1/YqeH-like C-terminal domain-containing protein n=1 Tax=Dendrobium nobile TaxID=94219 RepID=A0A8T3AQY8_DENNO|nr:hypothetical protein KFK09_022823 [Dendrobium nobile]
MVCCQSSTYTSYFGYLSNDYYSRLLPSIGGITKCVDLASPSNPTNLRDSDYWSSRQAAVVHSEDLPFLAPQSRLRGQSFPIVSKRNLTGTDNVDLSGFSIFWGGLVRIDILKGLPQTRLTFFGPRKLQILMVPTAEADEFYHKEVGVLLTPPSEKLRELWPGLQSVRQLKIKFEDQKIPASDITISGLGWISVEPFGLGVGQNEFVDCKGELHLDVRVPKPVEIFVRPPMPVGSGSAEWYQYQELTEAEEELRPKWYY